MTTGSGPDLVAGIDGCPGGWVVVTADRCSLIEADVVTDLEPVVVAVRDGLLAAVAIDMPIGLLTDRPRQADILARALLGPRRSSVFPAPVRPVLAATTYREACELSRSACGKALSKQTYNLVDRIRRLDDILRPDDGERIVEAHPELAFLRLAGEPLAPKKHPDGRRRRIDLLDEALGPRFTGLREASPAPVTDLLDAAALVTTAWRVVDGDEVSLEGEHDEVDESGKRIRVVY